MGDTNEDLRHDLRIACSYVFHYCVEIMVQKLTSGPRHLLPTFLLSRTFRLILRVEKINSIALQRKKILILYSVELRRRENIVKMENTK